MKLKFTPLLALLLCLGCSGHSFQWVGTWHGDRGYVPKMGENPAIIGTATQVKLEIRDDGTFSLEDGGVPIEGDVNYEGDTIRLVPVKVLNVDARRAGPPLNSSLLLQPGSDGVATFSRDGDPTKVALHRG